MHPQDGRVAGYIGWVQLVRFVEVFMKSKTRPSEIDTLLQRLDAQDTQLAAQAREVERLRARMDEDGKGHDSPVRSRRDVLRLAGAAVIGAAGAAALRVVPAAATNGDAITVGSAFTGTTTTQLTTTGTDSFISIADTAGVGVIGSGNVGVRGQGTATDAVGIEGFGSSPGCVGGSFDGIRAPITIAGQSSDGPPISGAHDIGDVWPDGHGIIWFCIAGGTPGVFAPLQTGGANLSHFVKVSNLQYHLANSNGTTWVDMDATHLVQVITPAFNAQAVISVSTDLWTANAGFNQDIGIFITGGAYTGSGTGTIVAWKESGGFAGTFSPNAAFVETTQPLVAGTAYTIKVRWKTNKPAGVATIYAGAGPLPPGSAGGGVTGQISPTRLATHLVVDVPSPSVLTIPANNPSAKPPLPLRLRK
jgi:hypothetical protein